MDGQSLVLLGGSAIGLLVVGVLFKRRAAVRLRVSQLALTGETGEAETRTSLKGVRARNIEIDTKGSVDAEEVDATRDLRIRNRD